MIIAIIWEVVQYQIPKRSKFIHIANYSPNRIKKLVFVSKYNYRHKLRMDESSHFLLYFLNLKVLHLNRFKIT